MKKNLTLVALGSALVLSGCMQGNTKNSELEKNPTGTVVPQQVETGTFRKKPQADVIGDTRKMKGITKVGVPGMTITFDKKAGQSAKATTGYGFKTGPEANVHVNAKLDGVDTATFQSIVDKGYADFVAQLKAAGYEVVGRDVLKKSKEFNGLNAEGFPEVEDDQAVVIASGYPDIHQKSFLNKVGKAKLVLDTMAGQTDVTMIYPDYLANFAAFGVQTNSGFGATGNRTASANVSLGQVAHVWGKVITSESQSTEAVLGQATYSEKPMGNFSETTNKAAKGIQTGLNVLSGLMGTSTRTDREHTLAANPAQFEAAMLDAIKKANKRLVAKLKAASDD
ncbi:hypothetical protein GP5015_1221 [gamma proteobacterium HTCC5015]|nr:hypothetical protein GP5015_1221 [gamma proteobacterium HTCC5015]